MTRTTRGRTAVSRSWTSKKIPFVPFSFFPSHIFFLSYSLDRAGDPPSEDSPDSRGKTPKYKVDKKAAKVLHERVIVRPNPHDSNPLPDFYAFFFAPVLQDGE